MNAQLSPNGVSSLFSPREILTNTRLDYSKHCKVQFGSYCQVFQDNHPSNTDLECTADAVCLGPTGNAQGGYKIFNLSTRKKIVRNQFRVLPMPHAIIEQVNEIGERENRVFDDEDWTIVPGGVDARSNWLPHVAGVEHDNNAGAPAPPPNLEAAEQESISNLESGHATMSDNEEEVSTGLESYNNEIADAEEWVPDDNSDEENTHPNIPSDDESDDEDGVEGDPDEDGDSTGEDRRRDQERYNLRPRRVRDYTHHFGFMTIGEEEVDTAGVNSRSAGVGLALVASGYTHALHHLREQELGFHYSNYLQQVTELDGDKELDAVMPRVAHRVMDHLSLNQGLRQFGDRGKDAVRTELQQIHMKQTFMPNHLRELTKTERVRALESLIFLEDKRTGKIKGHTDGQKQCE